MNYDDKLYICNKHYENYNSYCEECEINLCISCERDHKSHKKIYLGDIIINKDELLIFLTKTQLNIIKIYYNYN